MSEVSNRLSAAEAAEIRAFAKNYNDKGLFNVPVQYTMVMAECSVCKGSGELIALESYYSWRDCPSPVVVLCSDCETECLSSIKSYWGSARAMIKEMDELASIIDSRETWMVPRTSGIPSESTVKILLVHCSARDDINGLCLTIEFTPVGKECMSKSISAADFAKVNDIDLSSYLRKGKIGVIKRRIVESMEYTEGVSSEGLDDLVARAIEQSEMVLEDSVVEDHDDVDHGTIAEAD